MTSTRTKRRLYVSLSLYPCVVFLFFFFALCSALLSRLLPSSHIISPVLWVGARGADADADADANCWRWARMAVGECQSGCVRGATGHVMTVWGRGRLARGARLD